jgi:hypothetical protein
VVQRDLETRGYTPLELTIDGRPVGFRSMSEGPHWIAITDKAPDHALYVCASHVAPTDVRLERVGGRET